jgi:hypothetical protein
LRWEQAEVLRTLPMPPADYPLLDALSRWPARTKASEACPLPRRAG